MNIEANKNPFFLSRLEILWNGKVVTGVSFENREKPENDEELKKVLLDLVELIDAPAKEISKSLF